MHECLTDCVATHTFANSRHAYGLGCQNAQVLKANMNDLLQYSISPTHTSGEVGDDGVAGAGAMALR